MNPQTRFAMLRRLADEAPDFTTPVRGSVDTAVSEWLGRLAAIIEDDGNATDLITLRVAADSLGSTLHARSVTQIRNVLHRSIAREQLLLPSEAAGGVILAGSPFAALSNLARVISSATREWMLVDPYLGQRAFTDLAVQAAPGVIVKMLASKGKAGPALEPLARRWRDEWKDQRPIEVRGAAKGVLHDRWIFVDGTEAWSCSQSFEHFAERSPAIIQRLDQDYEADKIDAYNVVWRDAEALGI